MASKWLSFDDLYGDIFPLRSVLDLCQNILVHCSAPGTASAVKKTKHWERVSGRQCAAKVPTQNWVRCWLLKYWIWSSEPFSEEVITMKMSRSLKVFEGSIIRSEKLFNLISQVIIFWYPAYFNIYVDQIVFFNTAEALLLPLGQKATSLYTLMLFNSASYCLTYLHCLVTRWHTTCTLHSPPSWQRRVFLTGKDGGQRSHPSFYDHRQVCAGMDQGERQLLLKRFTKSIYGYLYKTIYKV